MRKVSYLAVLLGLCLIANGPAQAQTDDVRRVTGLPIPIGAAVIYGEVKIRGLTTNEPRPRIHVSLILGGVQVDRTQTNDRGFYYFLRSPSDGATMVFEVNDSEVGRVVLSAGTGRTVRHDVEIDWQSVLAKRAAPAVVSARNLYVRSADAERVFDRAMDAVRAKRTEEALALFKQIVEKDPLDFVAWTELGTLHFDNSKYLDAEAAYGKALRQKPQFTPAWMNLGKLYLSQKKFDMAVQVFFRAADSDPTSAEAFHYLGEAYLEAKQGSKAAIALNEAIRLDPVGMADVHLRLASLFNAAGAKDRAAAEYKLFLEKRPNYAERQKLDAYIKANSPK